MQVHLIVTGKLKNKELEKIEMDYLKRINSPSLKIHEVKAKAEKKELEGKVIISKVQELSKSSSISFLLTEWGKEYTSVSFSKKIFDVLDYGKSLIFIICGAEGPSDELKSFVNESFSLSKLTFPHKIARIIFIEQFYRAITIKNNHPYHN